MSINVYFKFHYCKCSRTSPPEYHHESHSRRGNFTKNVNAQDTLCHASSINVYSPMKIELCQLSILRCLSSGWLNSRLPISWGLSSASSATFQPAFLREWITNSKPLTTYLTVLLASSLKPLDILITAGIRLLSSDAAAGTLQSLLIYW